MALEIMDRRSMFYMPMHGQHRNVDTIDVFDPPSLPAPNPPIIYNYLHDVESLYWVHLWILLSRISHGPSLMLANEVFLNDGYPSGKRRTLFENGINEATFHPDVQPLVRFLNGVPLALLDAYRYSRLDDRHDSVYTDVYGTMHLLCHKSLQVKGLKLLPLQRLSYSTVSETVEKMKLGKRRGAGSIPYVELPMRRKRLRSEDVLPTQRGDNDISC